MSKKAILSALLVSSALLGTASANAATSALKDESKLVSVEKDGVKIYSNSKLESSKKVAKGTVYKVDGYRDINSKKYYRVYQQDTEGKNVYKGYVLAADAQDLKAGSVDKKDRFVGLTEDGQKAWKNLYFNREIKTYNGKKHSSNFEVKRTYEIGGKKYFSLYRGEKWMGYMDGSAFKVLTPEAIEEGKQAYTVAKDAKTYNDIYFTAKGELKAGEKVTVKRVYTFGTGRKYASAYNEAGKWVGYVNLSLLSEDKVADEETQKAIDAANDAIKKAEEILSKAQASKESKEAAQKVIDAAKETVKNGNLEDIKKVPAQISDAIKALKPGATTIDIQKVQEAIEEGKKALDDLGTLGVGSQDKAKVEALKDAIANAEKVVADMKKGDASTEDADKAVAAIEKAINDLGLPATSISLEQLRMAIKAAEDLLNKTQNADVTGRDELAKEVAKAKQMLEDAKAGKVNGKEVADEVKALEDAMANVKFDKKALLDEVTAVQKLASDVYMTNEGEQKFVKAMTAIMNLDANGGNYTQYLEAKTILKEAKEGLEKQPNTEDGKALVAALKKVEGLAKLPNKGKDLNGAPALKDAYNAAVKVFMELEKDTKKENLATVKISKAKVQQVTNDLNKALEGLAVNEEGLNTFIKSAQELAKNDSKFQNDKEFQTAVDALVEAAKNTSVDNYNNIVAAAQKVYNMMIQDLQAVYNGVLPWNNNQEEVNPTVKPVEPAEKPEQSKKEKDNEAVAGSTLSGRQFANSVLKAAPKVGDYYTKASYDAFTTAMTAAKTIIADSKTKDKVISADSAKAGVQVNNAMKALVDAQDGLRFDREKLENFSEKGNGAIQQWLKANNKKVKENSVTSVEDNAQAANGGFWTLGYKYTAYNTDKPEQIGKWNDEKSFLATAKDEDFKATKANAEKITKLVYNAENDYYKYIETVTVAEKGE